MSREADPGTQRSTPADPVATGELGTFQHHTRMILPLRLAGQGGSRSQDLTLATERLDARGAPRQMREIDQGVDPPRFWTTLGDGKRHMQRRFLLPFVRDLLDDPEDRDIAHNEVGIVRRQIAPETLERLTIGGRPLALTKRSGAQFPFLIHLSDIELYLFDSMLCFVLVELTIDGRDARLSEAQDLAYALRSVSEDECELVQLSLVPAPARRNEKRSEVELTEAQRAKQLERERARTTDDRFFNRIIAGESFTFPELLLWLVDTGAPKEPSPSSAARALPLSPGWGPRLCAYHVLAFDGEIPGDHHLAQWPATPELLRLTRLGHSGYQIRPHDLDPARNPALFRGSGNVLFSLGRESSVVLRASGTAEFETEQEQRTRWGYVLLLLLTMHQSIRLLELQREGAAVYNGVLGGTPSNGPLEARIEAVKNLLSSVLAFTLRHCYSEVSGHTYYRLAYKGWHDVFGVRATWDDLRNEVRELDDVFDRLQQSQMLQTQNEIIARQSDLLRQEVSSAREESLRNQRDRRFQTWMTVLGTLLLPPTVVFSYFGMNYQTMDETSIFLPSRPSDLMLIAPAVGLTLIFLILMVGFGWTRRKEG